MTNLQRIDEINSLYKIPTDEQITQILKVCCINFSWTLEAVKQHYYD